MQFTFSAPGRIVFGCGTASEIPELAASLGTKLCLLTGNSSSRHDSLRDALERAGLKPTLLSLSGEPETESVLDVTHQARETGCNVVVAVGGGSVIDTAKAVAALLTNPGDLMDHLEVVGRGLPITERPAPLVAVPTTSGTGAEVTANAVLLSREHGVKVSMRSPLMIPDVAVVDPELAVGMPPTVTAHTGLDALTQLLEGLVSIKATPMTDSFCRDGLARIADALPRAFHDPEDIDAREDMAYAAMLSGLSLANGGLGAVHGFAGPIGGAFAAPHGAICAALLPHVMRANIQALSERDSGSSRLAAYIGATWLLCGTADAEPDDGVRFVEDLCDELGVAGLAAYGMEETDIEPMVDAAMRSSSMKGNPVELTREELREILRRAL